MGIGAFTHFLQGVQANIATKPFFLGDVVFKNLALFMRGQGLQNGNAPYGREQRAAGAG